MSLPFVGFVAISFMATPAAQNSLWFLLGFPLGYLIFGFVFTTLAAWVYNLIAKWVGGIEYTSITLENT
jgi:hypothetical protein